MNQRKLQSGTPKLILGINKYFWIQFLFANLNYFLSESLSSNRFVVRRLGYDVYTPKGGIKFDEKIIDPSNAFNIEEGIFKVPSSGICSFFFDGASVLRERGGVSTVTEVCVKVNGNDVYHYFAAYNSESTITHHVNFIFAYKLEKDDELLLYNKNSNTLTTPNNSQMTFVGYKTN